MRRSNKFPRGFALSAMIPKTETKQNLSMRNTAEAIKRLIEDEFDGLCEVKTAICRKTHGAINIADEYAAYLFREVMSALMSREVMHITVEDKSDVFSITFSVPSLISGEVDYEAYSRILAAAKKAGFSVKYSDKDGIAITLAVRITSERIAIYAIDTESFYDVLKRIFYS